MKGQTFNYGAYSEYMDDMNYSQGFYVTKREDEWVMGAVRRVEDSDDDRFIKAERAAMFAVVEHNKYKAAAGKEALLRFHKIVNLNVEPTAGTIYYITASIEKYAGERCLYQLKIWETLKSAYKVQKFEPAPYWIGLSDKFDLEDFRLTINNLMPWMNENYLYYKCFLASREVRAIEVVEGNKANLWLGNPLKKEKFVNKHEGRKMPHTDIFYSFDL